ncbi:hypothetical protein PM082_014099 [Marasmius tenuissimus]|nr:hypothetical protein PM082_014099 [Marasmius tenuissimus]
MRGSPRYTTSPCSLLRRLLSSHLSWSVSFRGYTSRFFFRRSPYYAEKWDQALYVLTWGAPRLFCSY